MKPVLQWVKANLISVLCALVAVAALPALLFVGNGKNTSLVDSVSNEVQGYDRTLRQLSVTYSVPTLDPSSPPTEFTRTPNKATTDAVVQAINRVQAESQEVLQAATDFNKADKVLLMEGLFPEPAGSELPLRQRFGAMWVLAHKNLLERKINAGLPPNPNAVRTYVENRLTSLEEEMLAGREGEQLTPAQQEQMLQAGREARLGLYRDHAQGLTVYAADDVFQGVVAPDPTQPPTLPMIWDMQHRFWVHETVLEAIVVANTNPLNDLLLPLPEAPVKRILSIKADDWNLAFGSASPAASSTEIPIASDYEASVTGHTAWPSAPNALFDIRYVNITLHVRSDGVPAVLDALSSTNLMTVVECSLTSVDAQALLEAGFYYGGGHVMEMQVRLETVWLRSWTHETMPQSIKRVLGVPVQNAGDEFQDDTEQF